MAKLDVPKLYKQYQKFLELNPEIKGTLAKFCKSKRPHLKYDRVRIAFMRYEKKLKDPNTAEQVKKLKSRPKEPKKRQYIRTYTQVARNPKTNKTEQKKPECLTVENIENLPIAHTLQVPTADTIAVQVVDENGEAIDIIPVTVPKDPALLEKWAEVAEIYVNEKTTPGEAYMRVYNPKSIFVARTCAAELFRRPVVSEYIYYLKCVRAAKDQVRLEEINKLRKSFVDTTVFDFGEIDNGLFSFKDQDEIDADKAKAIKALTTKREIRVERGPNGKPTDFEIIKEEVRFEMHDKLKAMVDEEKARKEPLSANTKYNDPAIAQLWERFQRQGDVDSISAIDLAHELASRGLAVPVSVQTQAKFELSVDDDNPDDGEGFDFDSLDRQYKDYQKHFIGEVEVFLPERKAEIKEMYLEHGFKPTDKPKDITINEDNITDPDD